jgi:hypothetical protein
MRSARTVTFAVALILGLAVLALVILWLLHETSTPGERLLDAVGEAVREAGSRWADEDEKERKQAEKARRKKLERLWKRHGRSIRVVLRGTAKCPDGHRPFLDEDSKITWIPYPKGSKYAVRAPYLSGVPIEGKLKGDTVRFVPYDTRFWLEARVKGRRFISAEMMGSSPSMPGCLLSLSVKPAGAKGKRR